MSEEPIAVIEERDEDSSDEAFSGPFLHESKIPKLTVSKSIELIPGLIKRSNKANKEKSKRRERRHSKTAKIEMQEEDSPPVIVAGDESGSWLIEKHLDDEDTEAAIPYDFQHAYANNYAEKDHANFLFTKAGQLETDPQIATAVLSVLVEGERPQLLKNLDLGRNHRYIYQHETGFEEGVFSNVPSKTEESFSFHFSQWLSTTLNTQTASVYPINQDEDNFIKDLLHFEASHSRKITKMKVAVLYAKPGQTQMSDIWANIPPANSSFFRFLDSLAERIDLKTWKGYRGDISPQDNVTAAYYKVWNGAETIFHVAPWMDEEQHRRLCGNDIAVLIYHDIHAGDDGVSSKELSYTPFGALDMGVVPQVFGVVQPHPTDPTLHRVGFFQRPNVGHYSPLSPSPSIYFTAETLSDWLGTKFYNGTYKSFMVPPLDRLFNFPRASAIEKLGQKYSAERMTKPSEIKAEKSKKKKLRRVQTFFTGPMEKVMDKIDFRDNVISPRSRKESNPTPPKKQSPVWIAVETDKSLTASEEEFSEHIALPMSDKVKLEKTKSAKGKNSNDS